MRRTSCDKVGCNFLRYRFFSFHSTESVDKETHTDYPFYSSVQKQRIQAHAKVCVVHKAHASAVCAIWTLSQQSHEAENPISMLVIHTATVAAATVMSPQPSSIGRD